MDPSVKDSLDSFEFDDSISLSDSEWYYDNSIGYLNLNEARHHAAAQDMLLEGVGVASQRIHATDVTTNYEVDDFNEFVSDVCADGQDMSTHPPDVECVDVNVAVDILTEATVTEATVTEATVTEASVTILNKHHESANRTVTIQNKHHESANRTVTEATVTIVDRLSELDEDVDPADDEDGYQTGDTEVQYSDEDDVDPVDDPVDDPIDDVDPVDDPVDDPIDDVDDTIAQASDEDTADEDMDAEEYRLDTKCKKCQNDIDDDDPVTGGEYIQNVSTDRYCSLKCLADDGNVVTCSHEGCEPSFDHKLDLRGFDDGTDALYCPLHHRLKAKAMKNRLQLEERIVNRAKRITPKQHKMKSAWHSHPVEEMTNEMCLRYYGQDLKTIEYGRTHELKKTDGGKIVWTCEYPGCGKTMEGVDNKILKRHLWSDHISCVSESEQHSEFMKCRKHHGNVDFLVVTNEEDGLKYPWTPNPRLYTCQFQCHDHPCFVTDDRVCQTTNRANLNRHYVKKHMKQIHERHGPFDLDPHTGNIPSDIFAKILPRRQHGKKRKRTSSRSSSRSRSRSMLTTCC